jgi:hypothetical protein
MQPAYTRNGTPYPLRYQGKAAFAVDIAGWKSHIL